MIRAKKKPGVAELIPVLFVKEIFSEVEVKSKNFPGWFKFYWRDWLEDDFVILSNVCVLGAYIKLLVFQFRYGSIPVSGSDVGAIISDPKRFRMVWQKLENKFPISEDGKCRQNPRMKEVREEAIRYWEQRAEAGARSASVRTGDQRALQPYQIPDDGITSTILPKLNIAREAIDEPEAVVTFARGSWKKKSDALRTAKTFCQHRPVKSHYGRTLVVRNALDCWARRGKLKNPIGTFISRAKGGKEKLLRSGKRFHDEAAKIVGGWRT